MSWLLVICVVLTALAMSLALAHALELPGKLRLDQAAYRQVQGIYYPGFTWGGLGEVLGLLATAALVGLTPSQHAIYPWLLGGLGGLVVMQVIYWTVTHPINRFWLADNPVGRLGQSFFGLRSDSSEGDWRQLRDRWEYSHVGRALAALAAFLCLTIGLAIE